MARSYDHRETRPIVKAQLLEGIAHKGHRGHGVPHILITDLSWEGHAFIATLQYDTVWGQLKQKFSAAQLATLPLGLVKDLGFEVLRRLKFAQLG